MSTGLPLEGSGPINPPHGRSMTVPERRIHIPTMSAELQAFCGRNGCLLVDSRSEPLRHFATKRPVRTIIPSLEAVQNARPPRRMVAHLSRSFTFGFWTLAFGAEGPRRNRQLSLATPLRRDPHDSFEWPLWLSRPPRKLHGDRSAYLSKRPPENLASRPKHHPNTLAISLPNVRFGP